MPGAISRTTGSATKWNSLTPAFIRNGSVQPFSVTTGLYGRPAPVTPAGRYGGCVSGPVWITGSGSEAIATLLTEAAPATAVIALAPRMNSRREVIASSPVQCGAAP